MDSAQKFPIEYQDYPPEDVFSVFRDDDDGVPMEIVSGAKPEVVLPGGAVPVSEAAAKLGKLLASTERFYRRGGAVVQQNRDDAGEPILNPVKPAELPSAFESVAKLSKFTQSKNGPVKSSSICNEQTAKLILNAATFCNELPRIRLLSPCPVLVEHDGDLRQVAGGYDHESCVLAFGEVEQDVPVGAAVNYLLKLLGDFRFASPSDRSRAIAAMITPALAQGNLLGRRAPVDLGEADQSQTGKGFRNKMTAALYGQLVRTVTQRKGGVGSLEETFNSALVRGANFINFDNIRGSIDSPAIESFLTEDLYAARVPHTPVVEVETRRTVVMMTSNKAEITPDLAKRSSCTRLLKQESDYQFIDYPEGDILEHVRENQPLYLGCVFSVVREWHRQGQRRTTDTRHDFKAWARTLDWIVQELFQAAPLLDGHQQTQQRMTNPALNWLRDLALVVIQTGQDDNWLRAHELIDIIDGSGVEIPGVAEDADLGDDEIRHKALLSVGRKMGKCFCTDDRTEIDNMIVDRREGLDDLSRKRHEYRFGRRSPA